MKKLLFSVLVFFVSLTVVSAINGAKATMVIDDKNHINKQIIIENKEENLVVKVPKSGKIPRNIYGFHINMGKINSNANYKVDKDKMLLKDLSNQERVVINYEYDINYKQNDGFEYFEVIEGIDKQIDSLIIQIRFEEEYEVKNLKLFINGKEITKYSNSDKNTLAKIQKALAIIQFKIEGQLIKKHPEFKMKDRLLLDKMDLEKGVVKIGSNEYKLNDTYFPTINPRRPYELTSEEKEVMERLRFSFMHSEKLNRHINFLYAKGHIYQRFNLNLLFHGCIPMKENGEFDEVEIMGKKLKGKELMDYIENVAHKAYFGEDSEDKQDAVDWMWYFWGGPKSPLFGKEKTATFERYFLSDKETHKEKKNPYYSLYNDEKICEKILENFGLSPKDDSHIINGHVPVKAKDGENPVKANGRLIVIDGGFAKAYQPTTGIAGYTLTYNSNGLVLAMNEPFESKCKAIEEGSDIKMQTILKENIRERKRVADTDIGTRLKGEIEDLRKLLNAYREGELKEII